MSDGGDCRTAPATPGLLKSLTGNIEGILADGRKDKTMVRTFDRETGRYHVRIKKENHVTIVSEPGGEYRHHFTPDEATPGSKPAKQEAKKIYDWMKKTKSEETVKLVGGDSTNPNTGWAGGVLAWLEKFLGRKVFWMICMLHTNELPLRHLIEKLDGKTSSK